MDCFICTILPWPLTWAPYGYHLCDGTNLQVGQYQAVYSLIGTYFGGSTNANFNLPDFRGRTMLGAGIPAFSPATNYQIGQFGGTAATTLSIANLPAHGHAMPSATSLGLKVVPGDTDANATGSPNPSTAYNLTGVKTNTDGIETLTTAGPYTTTTPPANAATINMNGSITGNTGNTGSGSAFSNLPPYGVLNFMFCLNGIYPTRD